MGSVSLVTKLCLKCGCSKSIEQFHKDKTKPDGHKSICNECSNKYRAEHYVTNREKVLAKGKEYYLANREKVLAGRRQYHADNPEKAMVRHARKRAKLKGLPFSIRAEDIFVPSVCPALGIPLKVGGDILDDSPTLDRIIPDNGYVEDNIIVVSDLANRIKSNATPDQIIAVGKFYKRLMENDTVRKRLRSLGRRASKQVRHSGARSSSRARQRTR